MGPASPPEWAKWAKKGAYVEMEGCREAGCGSSWWPAKVLKNPRRYSEEEREYYSCDLVMRLQLHEVQPDVRDGRWTRDGASGWYTTVATDKDEQAVPLESLRPIPPHQRLDLNRLKLGVGVDLLWNCTWWAGWVCRIEETGDFYVYCDPLMPGHQGKLHVVRVEEVESFDPTSVHMDMDVNLRAARPTVVFHRQGRKKWTEEEVSDPDLLARIVQDAVYEPREGDPAMGTELVVEDRRPEHVRKRAEEEAGLLSGESSGEDFSDLVHRRTPRKRGRQGGRARGERRRAASGQEAGSQGTEEGATEGGRASAAAETGPGSAGREQPGGSSLGEAQARKKSRGASEGRGGVAGPASGPGAGPAGPQTEAGRGVERRALMEVGDGGTLRGSEAGRVDAEDVGDAESRGGSREAGAKAGPRQQVQAAGGRRAEVKRVREDSKDVSDKSTSRGSTSAGGGEGSSEESSSDSDSSESESSEDGSAGAGVVKVGMGASRGAERRPAATAEGRPNGIFRAGALANLDVMKRRPAPQLKRMGSKPGQLMGNRVRKSTVPVGAKGREHGGMGAALAAKAGGGVVKQRGMEKSVAPRVSEDLLDELHVMVRKHGLSSKAIAADPVFKDKYPLWTEERVAKHFKNNANDFTGDIKSHQLHVAAKSNALGHAREERDGAVEGEGAPTTAAGRSAGAGLGPAAALVAPLRVQPPPAPGGSASASPLGLAGPIAMWEEPAGARVGPAPRDPRRRPGAAPRVANGGVPPAPGPPPPPPPPRVGPVAPSAPDWVPSHAPPELRDAKDRVEAALGLLERRFGALGPEKLGLWGEGVDPSTRAFVCLDNLGEHFDDDALWVLLEQLPEWLRPQEARVAVLGSENAAAPWQQAQGPGEAVQHVRRCLGWAWAKFADETSAGLAIRVLNIAYVKGPKDPILRPVLAHRPTWTYEATSTKGKFSGHLRVLKMSDGATLSGAFGEQLEVVPVEHESAHFCQTNTVEYDLALQWRQMQLVFREMRKEVRIKHIQKVEALLRDKYPDQLRAEEVEEVAPQPCLHAVLLSRLSPAFGSNISTQTPEENLKDSLSQFASIKGVSLVCDPVTGRFTGHALALVEDPTRAEQLARQFQSMLFELRGSPRPVEARVFFQFPVTRHEEVQGEGGVTRWVPVSEGSQWTMDDALELLLQGRRLRNPRNARIKFIPSSGNVKIEWDGQLARDLREVLVTQARSNGELARFKARISLSAHRLHEHKLNKDLAKRETLENLHYTEPILRALHEKYDINYQRFTTRGGTTFRTHRGNYASSLDNTPGALVPRLTDEEQIKLQEVQRRANLIGIVDKLFPYPKDDIAKRIWAKPEKFARNA